MENYRFNYDAESDVLYIQNIDKEVEESVQSSEDIVVDLDYEGRVIGIEIFYASELFQLFNKEINEEFLCNLESVSLQYKEYRNNLMVILVMKSGERVISQILPPLRKSEYVSPITNF